MELFLNYFLPSSLFQELMVDVSKGNWLEIVGVVLVRPLPLVRRLHLAGIEAPEGVIVLFPEARTFLRTRVRVHVHGRRRRRRPGEIRPAFDAAVEIRIELGRSRRPLILGGLPPALHILREGTDFPSPTSAAATAAVEFFKIRVCCSAVHDAMSCLFLEGGQLGLKGYNLKIQENHQNSIFRPKFSFFWKTRTKKKRERGEKKANLLLKGENMGDTAIDGILKPSLSFIRDGNSGFATITHRKVSEELRHIASSKNLVYSWEMRSSLFMAEIRSKNTPPHTFPPQEFAGTTGGTSSSHIHQKI